MFSHVSVHRGEWPSEQKIEALPTMPWGRDGGVALVLFLVLFNGAPHEPVSGALRGPHLDRTWVPLPDRTEIPDLYRLHSGRYASCRHAGGLSCTWWQCLSSFRLLNLKIPHFDSLRFLNQFRVSCSSICRNVQQLKLVWVHCDMFRFVDLTIFS